MRITITGKPIAKKRPRFVRRGKHVDTYNAQETEDGRFVLDAKTQITERFTGPVSVECVFWMPRPKGHFGTGKNSGKLKASAPEHHVTTPDIDNCEKFVFDCLNGLAWHDDSQVVKVVSEKRYSTGREGRTEIWVESV